MKDFKQWPLRLVCWALIFALGAGYQHRARAWQQAAAENQAEIAEINAYNAEIQAEQARLEAEALAQSQTAEDAEPAETPEVPQMFADGVYTASAAGFGGDITVAVTLAGDQITDIEILSHDGEDDLYFADAAGMTDRIIAAQSTAVDAVSGATFSSTGIKNAVQNALRQAENP